MDGRIDLERARREAKALLRAWRAEGRSDVKLAEAQREVARSLGARSWPALVARAEAEAVALQERARAFVEAATDRRRDRADALLALAPEVARSGLDAALVLGDAEHVQAALASDATLALGGDVGVRGWPALCYVAHSAYLNGERTDGLLACARALLEAGADADAAWTHPQFGPQSALYGAAGVAHEPRMTALLLEAGANPDDNESVYHATEEPELRCLALLLDAGAAIVGTNALGHALDRADTGALELLLSRLGPVGEAERAGLGALVPAAVSRERDPAFLRLLAAAGAALEAVGREGGERAYALAVRFGRDDLARTLVELGARPQASAFDRLVGACRRGDEGAAEALLEADPALRDRLREDGMIAHAAADGNDAAVALLHDLGVPSSNRGGMGGTPLHWAAWWGRVSTTELLLDRGADPTATSPNPFSTPLGWAVHGSRNSPRVGDEDYLVVGHRLAQAGAPVEDGFADAAVGPLADWLRGGAADAAPVALADDRDGIGEHDWAAQAAYLRALAALESSAMIAVGDGFAVRTGADSNAAHGLVASAATGDEIAAARAFLGDAPAQWLTADPAFAAALEAAGLDVERDAVAMGAWPEQLARAAAPLAGVRIDRAAATATTPAGLTRWTALDGDGAEIGHAVTFAAGDALVLRELFVADGWRRRGLGRALAVTALAGAAPDTILIAEPTRTSQAFFAGLGFVLVRCPPDRVAYLR